MAGYKRKRGDNTWQLEYSSGKDYTGKRRRFSKTVHCTEKQAEKELARFIIECEDGLFGHSTPVTVADLCQSYLVDYSARHHKLSSQRSDKTACKIWIIPKLGKIKLNNIKKYDVQQWVNDMEDSGKSPKSIRNYFSVLRQMMDFAVDLDLINRNPCDNVRLPKRSKPMIRSFTKKEVSALLNALDNLPYKDLKYKCCILLGLFGGFRKGEIMGFNWDDLNLDNNEITVKRTRMIAPDIGVYEDTPKTELSGRTIVLPQFVVSELKRLQLQQKEQQLQFGQHYACSPAMIRAEDGEPLYPQVLQRWFTRFCEKNKLPTLGLHALRHTHASLLVDLGTDKMQVSTRLGHSNLSTTLNIYTHLFENRDKTIANELDQFRINIKAE